MRLSNYFIPTLREVPSEAEVVSHRLMLRAGMIKKVAAGIYDYLPLGLKVIRKVEHIVRTCMNDAGAVELVMPAVCPAELWQESGRWQHYGKELLRLKDRHERDFCVGPTHEEVITDIVRDSINSYKQLPVNLYQIQTKFRDEVRPRFGLMRGREFIMKDAYSFDVDDDGANVSYGKMRDAYRRIFEACGLKFKMVEADSGAIGGSYSHEFMVLADTGEDAVISCSACDYAANVERAVVADAGKLPDIAEAPMEEKETPKAHTVAEVAKVLDLPAERIVKTMIVDAGEEVGLVAVMVRGDHELNLAKVKNVLDVPNVELATPAQIVEATGGAVGFSGPVGLKIPVYADNALKYMKNYVVGANARDMHAINVNHERDFTVTAFDDFRNALPGDACPRCSGGTYETTRGIEVGHIFKLGTKYSESMNCTFLDQNGKAQHMIMGCYGIGVGRTAAAAIEQNHDDDGIIWPVQIAPFEVVVVPLNPNDEDVVNVAETVYIKLKDEGIDVLIDDRNERAGVKFKDADLIGYPLRVNVGKKGLEDGNVELFSRRDKNMQLVKKGEVIEAVLAELGRLRKMD